MTNKRPVLPTATTCICKSRASGTLLAGIIAGIFLTVVIAPALAVDDDFERPPISYSTSQPDNAITDLQARLDAGSSQLKFDAAHGYLASVLAELKIPAASQMMVFSKTSFQRTLISPEHPRALYFSDDTYVGWVPDGNIVEVATADPRLGAVFYTLTQQKAGHPRFERQMSSCLECHASTRTHDIPGFLLRSVFARATGEPIFSESTFFTTQESPLSERWGGWYVSARHGLPPNMGNQMFEEARDDSLIPGPVVNPMKLDDRVDAGRYLSAGSDPTALLVLAHQVEMHNLLIAANMRSRLALQYQSTLESASPAASKDLAEETRQRIETFAEPLVRYMLFSNEADLQGSVEGTSDFARRFAAAGPCDASGRSLRDLDLHHRLFKYPCSYLIYSREFAELPDPTKKYIYRRLWEILTGRDDDRAFANLSPSDCKAIYGILLATKDDLPEYWKKDPPR